MPNEKFDKIQVDEFKFFANKLYDLITERYKSIILLAQLLIALLIIASFSDSIISEDNIGYVKILIICLLFLVPIMLVDYSLKINEGINSLGGVLNFKEPEKRWYDRAIDGSNYVYLAVVIVAINSIILLINQNLMSSIIIFEIQFLIILIVAYLFVRKSKKIKNKK